MVVVVPVLPADDVSVPVDDVVVEDVWVVSVGAVPVDAIALAAVTTPALEAKPLGSGAWMFAIAPSRFPFGAFARNPT